MAKLKDLYELVHCLEKNEKKYVSLMIDATAGKASLRYHAAFTIINKQKTFDDEKLKTSLLKDVEGMNLSEANTNLLNFIQNALLSYRNPKESVFEREILSIEFLIKRKLYERAHNLLQKVRPQLEEKASYGLLTRADELQEILAIQYSRLRMDVSFRTNFYNEKIENARRNTLNIALLKLKFDFFQLVRHVGEPRSAIQLRKYKVLYGDPNLHLPSSDIPNRSLHSYFFLKGAFLTMMNAPNSQAQIKQDIRELQNRFQAKSALRGEYDLHDLFIATLSTNLVIQLEDLNEVTNRLRYIASELPKSNIAVLIENKIAMLTTLYFTKKGDYSAAIAFYEEEKRTKHIETWIHVPLAYSTIILTSINYFLAGKTKEALDLLLDIKDKEKSMGPMFLTIYQLLILLCHYKLKNLNYLESAVRSLQRNLRGKEKLYPLERALLRFLRNGNNINKLEQNFEKLHESFIQLNKGKFDKAFFNMASFMKLIEHVKITKN